MLGFPLRILVVEDQDELRRTIVGILKRLGAQAVFAATDGDEALGVVRENPIDFILSEWSLPSTSGMEFLRNIRTDPTTKNIPFAMICGRSQLDADDIAETAEFDIDAYLIKPLNQERLENLILSILEKREKLKESTTHLSRAVAYLDLGAIQEAETELESVHSTDPDSPSLWVESAKLYEAIGNTEKARNCLNQAIEIDEGYAKAYEGLADILEKEGKTTEAIEWLQKSIEVSPRNRDRQLKMAKTKLNHGDEEGARIALYQALDEKKDGAAQNAEAAEFFLNAGRADLAEAEYAFALEAEPGNLHYYNRLGLAFRRQKKIEEATQNYRKALSINPKDAVLLYNLAIAHVEGGETSQAMTALRRALSIQPNFPQAEKIFNKLQSNAKPSE